MEKKRKKPSPGQGRELHASRYHPVSVQHKPDPHLPLTRAFGTDLPPGGFIRTAPRRVQPLSYRLAATAGSLERKEGLLLLFIAFKTLVFKVEQSYHYPVKLIEQEKNIRLFFSMELDSHCARLKKQLFPPLQEQSSSGHFSEFR